MYLNNREDKMMEYNITAENVERNDDAITENRNITEDVVQKDITSMDYNNISEEDLREGAKKFERFWLMPNRYKDLVVPLRLRINKKWGGWKLKDSVVSSLGLTIGETINTEVTPCFMSGIIDDKDDTDLFASEEGADWLLNNNVGVGMVIDCIVRFVYTISPIGPDGKKISTISLVFKEGISVVETEQDVGETLKDDTENLTDFIRNLL